MTTVAPSLRSFDLLHPTVALLLTTCRPPPKITIALLQFSGPALPFCVLVSKINALNFNLGDYRHLCIIQRTSRPSNLSTFLTTFVIVAIWKSEKIAWCLRHCRTCKWGHPNYIAKFHWREIFCVLGDKNIGMCRPTFCLLSCLSRCDHASGCNIAVLYGVICLFARWRGRDSLGDFSLLIQPNFNSLYGVQF